MSGLPSMPNLPPGTGSLQRRAAQLKSEMEARARAMRASQQAQAAGQEGQTSTDEAADQTAGATVTEQAGAAQALGAGPVGQGEYLVKEGECICSIAKDTGHFWKTIWQDPANVELKQVRARPSILFPGDRVRVPSLRQKQESGQTEMRHRFVRKGEPQMLRIRVSRDGEPRANQAYTLDIDGQVHTGTTAPDGYLECPIPGNARRGTLSVGEPPGVQKYSLLLGHVDPVTAISGVQQRLKNLGFITAFRNGALDVRTRQAITAFQADRKLPQTGELDNATRQELVRVYGC